MMNTAAEILIPPEHGYEPGTARAAMSYRSFRIIFIGLALSNIGTWMQNFTLPAYIDDRTGRPSLVGLMVFMQLGPLLVLSIPAGVLADRVSKQKLQVSMQALSAIFTLVVAYCIAVDAAIWTLFASQLCIGIANAFNAPAFQSSMPLLVHRQDLPGAISLNSAMMNGTRVVGPVLAALLAAAGMPVSQIFVVNSFTYLFFIAALLYVHMPDVKSTDRPKGWRQLGTGIRTVRERLVLRRLLFGMFLFSLFSLVFIGLFPSVSRLAFGIQSGGSTYRWLYAVWGTGAFCGAMAVGTVFALLDRKMLIARGFVGFAISLGVFSQVREPGARVPGGLRARLHVLHDRHGDHDDAPAEHEEHRAGHRDAAVVHGVRRDRPDRQPDLRRRDRVDRGARGAGVRRRLRPVPGQVARPATPPPVGVPRGGRRR